jgi:hypothetical protein
VGILATFWWLGEDLASVAQVPIGALALGVGLTLINYLCGATRLTLLTRLVGAPVGFLRASRAYALGLFSAAITPGGTGQAPAVVLALIGDGVPASKSWSVNVYVWVVDLFFLTWSVPIGLAVLGDSTRLLRGVSPLLLGVLLSAAFLSLYLLLSFRLVWLRGLLGAVMRLRWLRRWRTPAMSFLTRVAEGLQLLLHVLTAALYLATYLTFYVVAVGVGGHPRLLPTMAAVQLPMVVSFLFPTPGGSGLLEILAASLFSAEGKGGSVGAAVLAWRLLSFYSRFVIGPALGGTVLLKRRASAGSDGAAGDVGGDERAEGADAGDPPGSADPAGGLQTAPHHGTPPESLDPSSDAPR